MPAGEIYTATENPKGEFGVYLVSDGTNRPYAARSARRASCISRRWMSMCKGHMLADVVGDHRLDGHRRSARSTDERPAHRRRSLGGQLRARRAELRVHRRETAGARRSWLATRRARQHSAVLPLLHLAQRQHGGWLPRAAIDHVADMLGMPRIRVYEVATFYDMFNTEPIGRFQVRVCTTTPCWLCGSDDVVAACQRDAGHRHRRDHRGRAVLPARVRVPGRLRQRADAAGQRRFLRGPRRPEDDGHARARTCKRGRAAGAGVRSRARSMARSRWVGVTDAARDGE